MTTVVPLVTYRNDKAYPFCPGCGHGQILDRLDEALVRLGRSPADVVIVTDIGCSGLSDQYFATNAFHGLHGRSITYATGIKLANPDLTVVVIMGDGGTGIGGAHLISAARRNVDLTVIVMNNLNFGMTGGQHSTTTYEGAVTSTTPGGNLEHPLDICATVGVNGAAYAYRGTSFDDDLGRRIADAIDRPGFAILDVWDLCTAYFVRNNTFSRRGIVEVMDANGFEAGVIYERDVAEYGASYRAAASRSGPPTSPAPIPITHTSSLQSRFTMTLAGAAGGRVVSAARLIGEGAIRSNLWVSQTSDYPVTVKTGHSLAQLTMTPAAEPIVPIAAPDAVVVVSDEGRHKVAGVLAVLPARATVVTTPEFADIETSAGLEVVDPAAARARVPRASLALVLGTVAVARLQPFPVEALREAADSGPFAAKNLEAIDAGTALA